MRTPVQVVPDGLIKNNNAHITTHPDDNMYTYIYICTHTSIYVHVYACGVIYIIQQRTVLVVHDYILQRQI